MAKEPKKTDAKAADSGNDAPVGSAENPVRVATVAPPAPEGGFVAGEALTPEQRAGLEPLDRERDNEEAADRDNRPNRQTEHELMAGLDPVSGSPTPGVTENVSYSGAATGAPPSDMSGRPPQPHPEPGTARAPADDKKNAVTNADKEHITTVRERLSMAQREDAKNDRVPDDRKGWRTPADIGVSGAILARLHDSGNYPLEMEAVPGGHFFPETGKRYRIKSGK